MELRFVVPNMEKTFGNLEFAGENTTEQQRINGRMAVITRSYNLYSDVQRADDVVVTLPAKAGEKHYSPEQKQNLSTHESLLMAIKSENVDLSITSYLQTICYQQKINKGVFRL